MLLQNKPRCLLLGERCWILALSIRYRHFARLMPCAEGSIFYKQLLPPPPKISSAEWPFESEAREYKKVETKDFDSNDYYKNNSERKPASFHIPKPRTSILPAICDARLYLLLNLFVPKIIFLQQKNKSYPVHSLTDIIS